MFSIALKQPTQYESLAAQNLLTAPAQSLPSQASRSSLASSPSPPKCMSSVFTSSTSPSPRLLCLQVISRPSRSSNPYCRPSSTLPKYLDISLLPLCSPFPFRIPTTAVRARCCCPCSHLLWEARSTTSRHDPQISLRTFVSCRGSGPG